MTAARLDLVAWRHTAFGGVLDPQDFIEEGFLRTGWTADLQIRAAPGDTATGGGLPVDLTTATPPAQGMSGTVDAAYANTNGTTGATIWRPYITKATMEAMPTNADKSQPIVLWYDLTISAPSSAGSIVIAFGTFTVMPGVGF